MKKYFSLALVLLPVMLAGCSHPRPVVMYEPPPAYSDAAQQGFRDGVRAGQHDVHQGLPPAPERHRNFDRPPVPPPLAEDYRHGFREGYGRVFQGGRPGY
jgi:hypothetical protein